MDDQIVECQGAGRLAADPLDLDFQLRDSQGILDRDFEPLRIHRLDDEITRTRAHGVDCGLHAATGGLNDNGRS